MTWTISSTVVSAIGVIVSVAGFWLALQQIRGVQTAASAAADAVRRAEARLAANQVLVMASQLRSTEADIDDAVERGDRAALLKLVGTWRRSASEFLGIVGRNGLISDELSDALRRSMETASSAKEAFMDAECDLVEATKALRMAIVTATDLTTEQAGSMVGLLGEGRSTDA